MSHLSPRARALAIAGVSALAVTGAAASSAQAAIDFDLKATCKYPLVGIQPLSLAVIADIPASVLIDKPTDRFTIKATATAGGNTSEAIKNLNAYSVSGEANALSSLKFPSGFVQNVAVPITVDKWSRVGTAIPSPLVLTAQGSTPELSLDERGNTDIFVDGLELNLVAYDKAGAPIEVKKITTDVYGNPFADSDGDKYTFDVSCKLDAGQNLKLATIDVREDVVVDPSPPPTPGPITVTPGETSADISWGAATDADGTVVGYDVTVNGKTTRVQGTSTTATGLSANTDYTVSIVAIDNKGGKGPASTKGFKTKDVAMPNEAPTKVLGLVAAPQTESWDVELKWEAASDADGTVIEYNVYRDGVLVKTVNGTSATVGGLLELKTYRFTVEAVDNRGIRGPLSDPLTIVTPQGPVIGVPPLDFPYELTGGATLRTLSKGRLPLAGSVLADLRIADGAVTADLALKPTQGRLTALGFLPVTAKVAFVSSGKTTGLLDDGVLTTKSLVRIKLPEVKLFGAIPLAGGNNCQTKQLSTINLRSTDNFDPYKGGSIAGTFAISDLNGCGVLNGLVSPLTAGGGNTIDLTLKYASRS